MDARLLIAINDVLPGLDADALFATNLSAEAGEHVRWAALHNAATKNSSTGTPNSELRGAAAKSATLATIGGGAKWAGGEGIGGGTRILKEADLKVQLATYGITAVKIVAQIGLRYAELVRLDRRAADDDQAIT